MVAVITVVLLELALSRRAMRGAFRRMPIVAAEVVVPALRALTGLCNLAALAFPLTYRERACGAEAGAAAGVGALLINHFTLALAPWLEAPAVAAAAVRQRRAQMER